jgi:transposase InsO family protein
VDRFIAGLCASFIRPARLLRSAIVIRPATILSFHPALVKRKYRLLFAPKNRGKPGPKEPSPELIAAIVEMKQRNRRFGCRRIAEQLSFIFEVDIDKDRVRRVLAKHYYPNPGGGGPSWLTLLGHSKDSLWSVDFFRCGSLILKTHWVMVVMDQMTRRIIGFAVHAGDPDGPAVCRLFNQIVTATPSRPRSISSDNDPLFEFHRWKANLRILEIEELKAVPYVPLSHPFVERLIGTARREFLDFEPFWNARDLERKLREFQGYYNHNRAHRALLGTTPDSNASIEDPRPLRLNDYRWNDYCNGLYQLPAAA